MPRRHEFETEVENDAEQTVKDMQFEENDASDEIGRGVRWFLGAML